MKVGEGGAGVRRVEGQREKARGGREKRKKWEKAGEVERDSKKIVKIYIF